MTATAHANSSDAALSRLRGSMVPLVTPFARDLSIDEGAFTSLVAMQIDAGTDGIVISGSTGESHALTLHERARLTEIAVGVARGRVPIIAATGCETLEETLALGAAAQAAGADALLVITPRAVEASRGGLLVYYCEIARSVELPVLVYNYPARTHVRIDVDLLERLVSVCPNVVGLKQTDPDISIVAQARRRLGREFRVFSGFESVALPALLLGAAGIITAAANVLPRELGDLAKHVAAGEIEAAQRLNDQIAERVTAILTWAPAPVSLKYLLHRSGRLPANAHRLPTEPAGPELAARLDALFAAA